MPLLIWLLLVAAATGVMLGQQRTSREAVAQRFNLRVALISDFVTSYTTDLINRERVQASTSLTDAQVSERDFTRAVAGFGYPAAVLLDSHGRALQVVPHEPALIGKDLTTRYAHLRTAVRGGRPAISPVVPSAVRAVPVAAFAVPFETRWGRRVFSGAVAIRNSPLSAYLTSALTLTGAQVQLVDGAGSIVAANRPLAGELPTLAGHNDALAGALRHHPGGRYTAGGVWWRYASTPIAGTPWRLSATVREDVMFASLAGNETAGHAALGAAAVVGLAVVVVAARARRSRRDLQLSEDRFRQMFDTSRTAMTLTNIHGRFLRVNPAACRLFGYAPDELVGSLFTDLTHPDDTTRTATLVHESLAGRIDGFALDKRYLDATGTTIEASTTTALLRDRDGQPQVFATQIIDMTEHRRLERQRQRNEAELAERAQQLQQLNTHLADFMAMLSHDLRQPLSNIVGLGELLLDDWTDCTDADKHRDVRRMTAAGHRASTLVTDILTLAQLDAGALIARPVRVDVAHAVREAVTAHQISADTPITVMAPDQAAGLADPAHLQLILGNLLANASKYGRPPVTVTVTNRRDHLTVQVSDRGDGVPAAFVPQLFDRFTRAGTGVATTTNGTGLGLYLVRQLAHAGGLEVTYQPNQPHGASFTVTVPALPTAQSHLRPDKESLAGRQADP
jgi:PAS domain S-box-containing protein